MDAEGFWHSVGFSEEFWGLRPGYRELGFGDGGRDVVIYIWRVFCLVGWDGDPGVGVENGDLGNGVRCAGLLMRGPFSCVRLGWNFSW